MSAHNGHEGHDRHRKPAILEGRCLSLTGSGDLSKSQAALQLYKIVSEDEITL
ncbi:hypothetical protein [Pseudochrobactrum sp. XF203]|uniref:hypothetical protein n=1 Tax=Pseudochrobactrum sp. XF203 TaxID=2879116 RepID=UPI001C8B73C8|nr:hypothetical protein [Pseudochrobactrum sp. XF203]MBX8784394.1 hypothetical protein [Ochrobactrum sp. GRS2]UCA45581.1 hypothetical protein LDL70_15060 [Pseudochrobactrum sp. XF203]